ncbi:MAG: secondary thiamine-phosphate synthase enzyme YjbQ [candidate division KSB1 bacterium]|nr:secondary thiamine-phosphate synthase enzyme YjbQ [candidate division KSB1 bacterium]
MVLKRIGLRTRQRVQFIDIDDQIAQIVRESGVRSGICVVFVPHTTAGVTINENADPDVVRDIIMSLNKHIPFEDGYYHGEGNSAAHIKSSLIGPSLSLIIEDGRVVLGTWQSVYFCEFDGPRERTFYVKILGD